MRIPGHIGEQEVMVKLQSDPSDWVRESMVEALGKIGGASWGGGRRRRFLGRALSVPRRLGGLMIGRKAPQPVRRGPR